MGAIGLLQDHIMPTNGSPRVDPGTSSGIGAKSKRLHNAHLGRHCFQTARRQFDVAAAWELVTTFEIARLQIRDARLLLATGPSSRCAVERFDQQPDEAMLI
jgi:hypothetical protein